MFKITAIVSLMLIENAPTLPPHKAHACKNNKPPSIVSLDTCFASLRGILRRCCRCDQYGVHPIKFAPYCHPLVQDIFERNSKGSTVWGTFSCDSCGNECVKACGTKHFRACCFNYLRKKRGPEHVKFWTPNAMEVKMEAPYKPKLPIIAFETVPDFYAELTKDFEPNPYEDTIENRLNMYEV